MHWYWSSFSGEQGLEIGGASGIFGDEFATAPYEFVVKP
jgi:hypothetical protein